MKFIITMALFLGSPLWAANFEGQTEFNHFEMEGQYRLTCFDGGQTEYKTHFCRGYILEPKMFAHFTHETEFEADELNLYNLQADGTTLYKKSGWDSETDQSTKTINLWVDTLLQTPFLHLGENRINWDLRENGTIRERGQIKVTVHDGGHRTCPSLADTFSGNNYCRNGAQACRHYFSQLNNCATSE